MTSTQGLNRPQEPTMEKVSLAFPLTCLLLSFLFTICFYCAAFRNLVQTTVKWVVRFCLPFFTAVVENGILFLCRYLLPWLQHFSRLAFVAFIVGVQVFYSVTRHICSPLYHAWIKNRLERVLEYIELRYQHLLYAVHRFQLALPLEHLRASYLYTIYVWYPSLQEVVERFFRASIHCLAHVYTQLSGNLTIEHLPTVDYFEDPIMSDIDSSIMSDIDGVPMSDSDEESHQNDRYTGHEVRQSPPLLSPVAQLISRNHQRRHGMSSLFVNPSSTASNASSSSSDLEILPDPPSPRMTARNLAQWSMQTARRSPRIRELRSPAFRVPHSPQTRGRAFRSRQAHTRGTAIHHGYATHPIQTYDSNTQVDEIPVWEVEYYDMEFFEEMHDLRQMPDFTWIDAAVDWSAESVFIVVAPNVAGARNQGRGSSFAA